MDCLFFGKRKMKEKKCPKYIYLADAILKTYVLLFHESGIVVFTFTEEYNSSTFNLVTVISALLLVGFPISFLLTFL